VALAWYARSFCEVVLDEAYRDGAYVYRATNFAIAQSFCEEERYSEPFFKHGYL